jgi:hypothetical protein
MMHGAISVFKPLIKALAGQSGLKHDMGVAQNIFKINYYLKKYKGNWQSLNLKFLNNLEDDADLENLRELAHAPAAISNETGDCYYVVACRLFYQISHMFTSICWCCCCFCREGVYVQVANTRKRG